jgi:hypothetical protein
MVGGGAGGTRQAVKTNCDDCYYFHCVHFIRQGKLSSLLAFPTLLAFLGRRAYSQPSSPCRLLESTPALTLALGGGPRTLYT